MCESCARALRARPAARGGCSRCASASWRPSRWTGACDPRPEGSALARVCTVRRRGSLWRLLLVRKSILATELVTDSLHHFTSTF